MSAINRFLLEHNLRIATNPCVSPDFCLDWQALSDQLRAGKLLKVYPKSRFETREGAWTLLE
ncbi:MAG: tagaturonate epimerase family protein, partial [Opitutaceae bacterium]